MNNLLKNLKKIVYVGSNKRTWEMIEYFDASWENRIQEMAHFIDSGKSILDLGCGKMWLKNHITKNPYYPVDYTSRGKDTIVCDFNKKEFPSQKADIAFISGTLEYIEDPEWFISCVSGACSECILSYCLSEYHPDKNFRQRQTWVNSFSNNEIIDLFSRHGFKLSKESVVIPNNKIFYFTKI